MRIRPFLACAAAACLGSSVLIAQTQTPAPTQKSPSNRVTVSGCVERADQMAGNTATTTVDSLSFVLIRAKSEKPTGTSGTVTAESREPAPADRMYRLDGPIDQLNPHVGQKVEITGTVTEMPTAPAGASSSTNAPRLRVDTVKVLDATCPR